MSSLNTWLKLYCDNKNTKHTNKNIKNIKFTSSANVIELEKPIIVVDTKTSAYGIFDNNKKLIKQSLQYRGKHHNFIPHKIPTKIPYIDEEAVYIGVTYPHFGHFLIEQLNRLCSFTITALSKQDILVVFVYCFDTDFLKYFMKFGSPIT